MFTTRVFRITEFVLDMVEPRSPRPDEVETEYAVLYGRDLSGERDHCVASLGLGYVMSDHRGRILPQTPLGLVHEVVSTGSIGVAFDVLVIFPLGTSVALGYQLPAISIGPDLSEVGS